MNEYVNKFVNTLNFLSCNSFLIISRFVAKKSFKNPWITPVIKKLIWTKSSYFQLFKLELISASENSIFKNKVRKIVEKKTDIDITKNLSKIIKITFLKPGS